MVGSSITSDVKMRMMFSLVPWHLQQLLSSNPLEEKHWVNIVQLPDEFIEQISGKAFSSIPQVIRKDPVGKKLDSSSRQSSLTYVSMGGNFSSSLLNPEATREDKYSSHESSKDEMEVTMDRQ